ncbi:MAG: response regulator transcription factor [Puniceicoccales bacterium]|jgi:DNA-binding response OmpR family regulator|nr:response regulator transcription factor [Puniceicoccales bacterium]MDR1233438.1 response regulator transcription factor [Puniceicoccales bacterium]
MNTNTPLVVLSEDDKKLAEILQKQIEFSGMDVRTFHDGSGTVEFLQKEVASILLLDINLPDIDGFDVIKQLQSSRVEIPVIFLTAFSDEYYKLKGFDAGAEDFITKPFSFTELIARIKVVLRRTYGRDRDSVSSNVALCDDDFEFCEAVVKPSLMQIIFKNGNAIPIRRKELGILKHFASNENTILSRRNLIHNVWGKYANIRSRSLDQYIVKIRQLLKENGSDANALRTLHGIGYIYTTKSGIPDMTRREYADTFDVML